METRLQRTGGAWNLNGIHYQLLRSLFQATRILECDAGPDPKSPHKSLLVLEPKTGGDHRIETAEGVVIEQMKTRSERAWSLGDIIYDVLPDLYKSFQKWDPQRLVLAVRFVTDGRRGRWKEIEKFFQELRPCNNLPDPIWKNLDSKRQLSGRSKIEKELKAKGLEFTQQGLFRFISQKLNRGIGSTPEGERSVWRFLSAFKFTPVSEDSLRQEVLKQLQGRLPKIEQARQVLSQLLGCFLDRGRDNRTIHPQELLDEFGLAEIDLRNREALQARSRRILDQYLANREYNVEMNVRAQRKTTPSGGESEELAGRTPVTVFHGENGQGKSWALYSDALSSAERGDCVLIIEATTQDLDWIRDRAAAEFCNEIRGVDEQITLERLSARVRRIDPGASRHWLTLLVDGVQDIGLARYLIMYDWARQGIRLAFALTTTGREDLRRDLRGCQLIEISDFSSRELFDFLKKHLGDQALQAPLSERSFLRRPLLAHLFCDLVRDSSADRPVNEFELLAAYWLERVRQKPLAMAKLAALAAEPPNGRPYPWSLPTLTSRFSEEEIEFLTQRSGLLRMISEGRSFEIWHDRLLNWAVAEGLVQLMRDRVVASDQLAERLWAILHSSQTEERWGDRWLRLAVHDTLWLLCEPDLALRSQACEILEKLTRGFGPPDVTGIGPRVIPVLFDLLKEDPGRNYAIEMLRQMDAEGLSKGAVELLQSEDVKTKLAAAEILQKHPTPDALDALWDLHLDIEHTASQSYRAVTAVRKSLNACASGADDWIRQKVRRSDPDTQPIDALAYLLPTLENGRQLWFELKKYFFDKIPRSKERSIVICLEAFRDHGHVDWLKERCNRQDDLVGAVARRALFVLQPERSTEPINKDAWQRLVWARHLWLLPFLNVGSSETQQLVPRIISTDKDPWQAACLFSDFENRINPEMLDLLLDDTANRLSGENTESDVSDGDQLWEPFSFLARIYSLPLIERFEARRGTAFEDNLVRWMCDRSSADERRSRNFEKAARLLIRTGGEGLTQVANHYLGSDCDFSVLLDAIELAVMRPDNHTADLLLELALRDEVTGQGDRIVTYGTGPPIPFAQRKAIGALVMTGRIELALQGAMKWGLQLSWDQTNLFLEHRIRENDLQPALATLLQSDEPDPGTVFAIGLARLNEYAPRIRDILEASTPGSELSRACLLALYLIRDRSPATVQALVANLHVPRNEKLSWLALFDVHTPEALTALKGYLERLKKGNLSSSDHAVLIASNLLTFEDEEVQRDTAEYLWNEVAPNTILFVTYGDLDPFADLDREDIDEWLCELSFDESGNHLAYGGQTRVISAFARRDPDRAFDAALRLRNLNTLDHGSIPSLLLEIDHSRALPVLHDWMTEETSVPVIAAMGEALWHADQIRPLIDWLEDSSPRLREGACIAVELLPWSDSLADALGRRLYDESLYVRIAANHALACLWRTHEIDLLVDEILAERDSARRWCLLDIALDATYPCLTGQERHPWLERLVSGLPLAMRQRTGERLKERRKKLQDELKKRKRAE